MRMKIHKLLALAICFPWLASSSAHGQAIFTSLVSFTFTNAPDYGAFGVGSRSGAMVQANDGNLYGTTPTGGVVTDVPGYFGTIFKMTPEGAFTSLYLFGTVFAGGNDNGHWPQGNLIQGADGNLKGTTQYGGPPNGGTVFQITSNGNLTTLYNFGNNAGFNSAEGWTNYDGDGPIGGLVEGRDGNFYGTTPSYGAYGNGTVFQLTPGGVLTTLHSFTALDSGNSYENTDGANPSGELIQGTDGSFYGTTTQGGTNSYGSGTVFRITATGDFVTLHSFSLGNGGCLGGLVQGHDGALYGTTSGGYGTVFQMTTNGDFTTLHAFSGSDGLEPFAGLILGSDGNLYGTTAGGGPTASYGTVFQITTNGTFTTLHAFSRTDGSNPNAALVQAVDGSFYGTTATGGPAGYGTIFHFVIPPAFQTITHTNGGIAFTWSAMPKQICQLQYSTNLASTNWLDFGNPITVANTSLFASDSTATNSQRFYRIRLLP
jgi:uncharacterized repeat protein (TIGR03803 family)